MTDNNNRPSERARDFLARHLRYAQIYENANPGRNNFGPAIRAIGDDMSEADLYDGQIYQLGSLSVFNRSTNNSSANLYVLLGEAGSS